MLKRHETHGNLKLTATILSVIVVAGIVIIADHLKAQQAVTGTFTASTTKSNSPSNGNSITPPASSNATSPSTSTSGSGFNDGTYTATSDYLVPDGQQSIEVSLTLKGGAISNVSVQNSENDPTSALFQQNFASAIKSQVVGKKISGLQLSVVAGASDTTQGFENALSQIANKAQG